ncbi:aromatic amino acid transaminase [Candidatus Protochlamydia phocaeensis]|uniref:amino acid aminotransferase n=1 Tax=Candidatus Protochlamydia phocaeensis TaxID=1414722 RepID=UPI0008393E48|nr:amino acid aminotransferase [Candidatus Protochlamydia phocaeensis]
MPFFSDVPLLPDDPILGLPIIFAADPRPNKINLGIGAYKTAEGHSLVLTSVKKAESQILQRHLPKDYLPIEGEGEFIKCGLQLLFGAESALLQSGQIFAAQTVGGSGALRLAGEFLAKLVSKTIFLSQPSWSNHKQIFEKSGLSVGSYPYFDPQGHGLDFAGMCEAIRNMPPSSAILLHGCCHNPTGVDPNFEQWKELSSLIKKQQIVPIFDLAYQGFGQSLDQDAQAIRYFAGEGHEMLVAYSFSKNFGLYGERVGLLAITASQAECMPKLASQIKFLIRCNYSTPPLQGARIISTILKSHELTLEWQRELKNMCERVKEMRKALIAALLVKGQDKNFSYMHQQNGLFSFCGLTPDQVQRLRQEKAIYMPSNGRINIAGLNTQNVEYVAESLLSVM